MVWFRSFPLKPFLVFLRFFHEVIVRRLGSISGAIFFLNFFIFKNFLLGGRTETLFVFVGSALRDSG